MGGAGGASGGGFLSSLLGLFSPQYRIAMNGGVGLYEKGGVFGSGISAHSNTVVTRPTLFAFAKGPV